MFSMSVLVVRSVWLSVFALRGSCALGLRVASSSASIREFECQRMIVGDGCSKFGMFHVCIGE